MQTSYDYAVRNGFTGTFGDYMTYNYQCYCNICHRCDSRPMSFEEWIERSE